MKRLLVDEVADSYVNKGRIETTYSNEEIINVVMRSLDGIVRFNAVTEKRHTVLVHSWYVGLVASDLAPDELKDLAWLMGMLHDCGEVIIGDFTLPIKSGKLYGELYQKYYEPFEKAFRAYFGEKVLGIENFDEKFDSVSEYVDMADTYIGDIEYFGETVEANSDVKKTLSEMFDTLDESVTIDKYVEKLFELSKKLQN